MTDQSPVRSLSALGLKALACVLALGIGQIPAMAQQGPGGARAPGAPSPAGYMVVETSEIPVTLALSGRAVAQNTTRLRPRVGGMITEILYSAGSLVTEGTPLFAIDPLTHEVAVAAAEATQAETAASLSAAKAAFDRAASLRQSNTGSAATLETAEAALRRAEAAHSAAEAALRLAKAQLDWAMVRAPITGIAGISQVSVGDLVTANQADALTEIVQIDPIQLDLTEPYPLRLKLEQRIAAGEITPEAPHLSLTLDDGRKVATSAKQVATSATVSATTGTRILRFELPNARGILSPGMFLRAELTIGKEVAILVPQRATQRERDGTLSAWVVEEGKARKRLLRETGSHGNTWVIREGLQAGDWLLLDGTNTLRDGQEVKPILATVDETGVVKDVAVDATPPAVGN